MMNPRFSRLTMFTLVALLMILVGCAGRSAPPKYYVLGSLSKLERGAEVAPGELEIAIGITAVELPAYLDRPQIVTRDVDGSKLQLAESDQWAEPLKEDFSRKLSENLSILLSTDRVFIYPWRRSAPIEYQVEVKVIRFDGDLAEKALLMARWTIFTGDGEEALLMKRSSFSEPVSGDSYEALVSAQSQALAALSREIAEAIKTLAQ